MKYLLTIYVPEAEPGTVTAEEGAAITQSYAVFAEELQAAGAYVAGEGLQPTSTATTVQVRGGERVVTDGPFADTKEALAGFFMVDCANLDEAIGWAAKIPGALTGSVEVRPIMDYEAIAHERQAAIGAQGA
jgi:hypothetical protein